VGKPERRPRHRWVDNINLYSRGMHPVARVIKLQDKTLFPTTITIFKFYFNFNLYFIIFLAFYIDYGNLPITLYFDSTDPL
jgi:hypothetical protein